MILSVSLDDGWVNIQLMMSVVILVLSVYAFTWFLSKTA